MRGPGDVVVVPDVRGRAVARRRPGRGVRGGLRPGPGLTKRVSYNDQCDVLRHSHLIVAGSVGGGGSGRLLGVLGVQPRLSAEAVEGPPDVLPHIGGAGRSSGGWLLLVPGHSEHQESPTQRVICPPLTCPRSPLSGQDQETFCGGKVLQRPYRDSAGPADTSLCSDKTRNDEPS